MTTTLTVTGRSIPICPSRAYELLEIQALYLCDDAEHGYHLVPDYPWNEIDVERLMLAVIAVAERDRLREQNAAMLEALKAIKKITKTATSLAALDAVHNVAALAIATGEHGQ